MVATVPNPGSPKAATRQRLRVVTGTRKEPTRRVFARCLLDQRDQVVDVYFRLVTFTDTLFQPATPNAAASCTYNDSVNGAASNITSGGGKLSKPRQSVAALC